MWKIHRKFNFLYTGESFYIYNYKVNKFLSSSLQNTIWVDPLVEKKMLSGIQTTTYSLDVGRDLLNLGYAEKNLKVCTYISIIYQYSFKLFIFIKVKTRPEGSVNFL